MSYKIGLILSSIFIVIAFLFACDLITIQNMYADLDAKSVSISYRVSKASKIDSTFVSQIENYYRVKFYCEMTGTPAFGDEIEYIVAIDFKPLIMSSERLTVSLERMAIVGYYG